MDYHLRIRYFDSIFIKFELYLLLQMIFRRIVILRSAPGQYFNFHRIFPVRSHADSGRRIVEKQLGLSYNLLDYILSQLNIIRISDIKPGIHPAPVCP